MSRRLPGGARRRGVFPRIAAVLLAALVASGVARARDGVDFAADVLPILEGACSNCHGRGDPTRKPKGGLRLDAAASILRGGQAGAVIVPGDAAASPLWARTVLDEDDLDSMPAKGDPLTRAQTEVLRRWIDAGADFGGWTGADAAAAPATRGPAVVPERIARLQRLGAGLEPLSEAALDQATGGLGRASPALPGSPLLRIDYVSREDRVADADVLRLAPVAGHVAQLDLGRTRISDAALAAIGAMPRLVRLDLHETAVTDAGLSSLSGLTELRYLNLFGTALTDEGLAALGTLRQLEALHLWRTGVTPSGVARLAGLLSDTHIHHVRELPPPQTDPE